MIAGLERVMAHRIWFVPRYMVWGLPGLGELEIATTETVGGSDTVYFGVNSIGDSTQTIAYSELQDHRGNYLPSTLTGPRVIPRNRGVRPVFIIGDEAPTSFKIARDPDADGPVETDLLIIEMNE